MLPILLLIPIILLGTVPAVFGQLCGTAVTNCNSLSLAACNSTISFTRSNTPRYCQASTHITDPVSQCPVLVSTWSGARIVFVYYGNGPLVNTPSYRLIDIAYQSPPGSCTAITAQGIRVSCGAPFDGATFSDAYLNPASDSSTCDHSTFVCRSSVPFTLSSSGAKGCGVLCSGASGSCSNLTLVAIGATSHLYCGDGNCVGAHVLCPNATTCVTVSGPNAGQVTAHNCLTDPFCDCNTTMGPIITTGTSPMDAANCFRCDRDCFCGSCAYSTNPGSCVAFPAGTDPNNECPGASTCNGAHGCNCFVSQSTVPTGSLDLQDFSCILTEDINAPLSWELRGSGAQLVCGPFSINITG